jgi:bifunctional DNase/RNase
MLVKVEFTSFAVDPDSNTPFIILKESSGGRIIPVTIGPLQAGFIAVETLRAPALQPLIIDLAKNLMEKLGGTLVRAIIGFSPSQGLQARLQARLDISTDEAVHHIECSPGDAVALSLRCRTPLFARESVFEKISQKNNLSERDELRTRIASLDTLEFGTVHLE